MTAPSTDVPVRAASAGGRAEHRPGTATTVPGHPSPDLFDVMTIWAHGAPRKQWVHSEQAALRVARSIDLRYVVQVTITAHTDDPDTFAVRHLSWRPGDPDGGTDSLWSVWLHGRHLDTYPPSLATVFGQVAP